MTTDKSGHGKKKQADELFTLKRMSYMFSVKKGKLMKQKLGDKNKLEVS